MDLSQQELPLTAYFTRTSKDAKSRAVLCKRNQPTGSSHSVARSSKRKKSDDRCSATSPLSSAAGQFNPRLQLPTPVTSVRKRIRGRYEELPASSTGVLLSSVEQNTISSGQEALVQVEDGHTPSKLPQSSRKGVEVAIPELPSTPLAIPPTDQRITKPNDIRSLSGRRFSNHAETGLATPRTLSRRIPESVHGVDDHTPSTRSLSSNPDQVWPDPGVLLPRVQLSARSTNGPPCSSVGCTDPFCAHEKNSASVSRGGAPAPHKQSFIPLETLDGQPSDGHVIPMLPVPSSQSQYLLHLDATPKRKRCSQRIEHVGSSQTQEEMELTISTPRKPVTSASLSGVSPRKHTPHGKAQIPRLICSERQSQHVYAAGSTSIGPTINSPTKPPHSSLATEKVSNELPSNFPSPLRRKRLALYYSPSKTKSPRVSVRHDLVENIPPAYIEDSLTESESDSDILHLKMKDDSTTHGLPSREMNQVPRHSPVPCNPRSPIRCAQGILSTEDDSATEAESDTEILHCVAEIGKKQSCGRRSEVPREDVPPPIISPLVSPARSRIATAAPIPVFTQLSKGSGSGASYPLNTEESHLRSESLPSVVRDFIRMFPGDESYPADFPESLRV